MDVDDDIVTVDDSESPSKSITPGHILFSASLYLFFIRSHTLLSARRVVPLEIPRSLRWHIHWVALVTLFGQGLVGIKTRLTSLGLGTVFDAFWWSGRLSRGRRRVGEGVRVVR